MHNPTSWPWEAKYDADGDHAIFGAQGELVAVTSGIGYVPPDVDAANASLLAAAPEVLAALKKLIGPLLVKQASPSASKAQYEFLKHLPETWAYIEGAHAAIAKAEGRQ